MGCHDVIRTPTCNWYLKRGHPRVFDPGALYDVILIRMEPDRGMSSWKVARDTPPTPSYLIV